MTDRITAQQFHEAAGVEDWRVLNLAAYAHFATGRFATGLALVNAIGELAEAANHHPDLNLQYRNVLVRLSSHDVHGLSERDVELARRISAAARELGVAADPSSLQWINLTIDALVGAEVQPFWRALLGYREDGPEDLIDPHGRGPDLWFQQLDATHSHRNRMHLDVAVPHDHAQARVDAAIAAGGRLVSDQRAPSWWVLADPEGNEACVATWMNRG
ncbi:MAG TPA: VOC family protein [Jatrophihabitans sp.]|nr:VOC family protein [Jatrophihabitans sp.]